jgi:acetyl-CoA carboxylase carboxyl transferase subunit alpha
MEMAAKFGIPILTIIDTQGAYPGIGAEERGQAEAIARNIKRIATLPVPILSIIIGEGGSGGALAIAVADEILIMENAFYSVISPEGCASILWRDSSKSPQDLYELKVVDGIIPEPVGGAHRDKEGAAALVAQAIEAFLNQSEQVDTETRIRRRLEKFYRMGTYTSM